MSRILTVAFALALTSTAGGLSAADPKPESVIGAKAPAPTLVGLDGRPADFAALRGKAATVVVFVGFECPVAKAYIGQLNDLAKAHADKGVAVVLVCPTDEPAAAVAQAAAPLKPAVPVLLDPKLELAAGLKAVATPEAFVLDAGGVVRYRGRIDDAFSARLKRNPKVTTHDLDDALAAVLAGKPVATAETKPVGCPIVYPEAAPKAGAVTFHRDVAVILNTHCVVCHRAGEVGPFPLTGYASARRWAGDIKEYTGNRQMPPWMPAAGVPMRGERKLTAKEIATLAAWADGGAPEGDPKDAPKAPDFGSDGWRHGKPDLVITPAEEFRLGASGDDLFRVFVIPTGLTENKWVVGYDVKPGNPRVVHHTLHYFDTSGKARILEKAQQEKDKGKLLLDRGPGYTAGMGVGFVPAGGSRDAPTFGGLGGWAPGQMPLRTPAGTGFLLPKGADFLIQTHYHRNGEFTGDRTQIGLYFAKGPIEQPWQTIVVNGMRPDEKIPAGKADHVARGAIYLHTDAVLHNVLPHMHLLGKTVKMTMTPPDGRPVVLIDIPAWNYNWQETYWFAEPIVAKAGTKIEIEAVFDNSTGNPYNPTRPPKDVTVGEQTTDEMLFGFLGVTSTKKPWEKIRTSAFPTPGVIEAKAPIEGKLTPELETRIGAWTSATVAKTRDGGETKMAGKETVTKAFGGTYLLIRGDADGDDWENFELATFDPAKKAYRMWTYTGDGAVIPWEGTWDEKAKAFAFFAPLTGGLTGALKLTLTADGTWDREFKVMLGPFTAYTATGTLTRKK